MTDEALEQTTETNPVLQAIAELSKKIDGIENQLEAVHEAIALDAKSIALMTRSQLTILTEEVRQEKRRTPV